MNGFIEEAAIYIYQKQEPTRGNIDQHTKLHWTLITLK